MAIYWVDISVDNIPNYQENDSNFPMGWEDYKTVRQTIELPTQYSTHTFYFKGIRDDFDSDFITGFNTREEILKWPGEDIWKLRVKNFNFSAGNIEFTFNDGIIFIEENINCQFYTTTGHIINLNNCFFKCDRADFDNWKTQLNFNNSVFICNNLMSINAQDGYIIHYANNSIVDTNIPINTKVLHGSCELNKSLFTATEYFKRFDDIENMYTSIHNIDCIFGYQAPIWPEFNDPKEAFSIANIDVSIVNPFKFLDVDITQSNCNINNINFGTKDDKLYVFSNNTYKHACSIYEVIEGELAKTGDKFFNKGLTIRDDQEAIIAGNEPDENRIGVISNLKDGSFSISTNNSVIVFNPEKEFHYNFIDEQFGSGDILGPIINNIYVSRDCVCFNGLLDGVYGSNLSFNPLESFNKYYGSKMLSVKKDNDKLIGLTYTEGFFINKNDNYATIKNNENEAVISFNNINTIITNTKILGACFYNDDIYYIKIHGNLPEIIDFDDIYKYAFPILCSVKKGELIKFKIKIPSEESVIDNSEVMDVFIKFKSIKIINNKLTLLFYNYDPIVINNNTKYDIIKSKYGIITSLDYMNNYYIAGIKKPTMKIKNNSHGNYIMKGISLTDLQIIESCSVRDIIFDNYRDLLYISTLFEFRVYDINFNLLKSYLTNPINLRIYDNIFIKNRFLLNSDIKDVRKIISSTNKLYDNSISFNDSIINNNNKIVSTGDKENKLNTNISKVVIMNNSDKISDYIDYSKPPLFSNNMSGIRQKDTFSIFSKDNKTNIIVEFSYDNNIIVYYPENNEFHDTKRVIIDSGITSINGEIDYNNIGLKVNNNYIIFRVDSLLKIFIIDKFNGLISLNYSVTLPNSDWPEVQSCIEIDNKILIPFGSNQILELINNETSVSFSRYIDITYESNPINIHQLELFNKIPMCIHSVDNESGYLGLLDISNDFKIIPLESSKLSYLKYDGIIIPIMKVTNDSITIIYTNSIVLSFDKSTIYGNRFLKNTINNLIKKINFNKTNKNQSIAISNDSLRKSKNRNFIKKDYKNEEYNDLYKSNTGIVRDFDTNTIFNIIKNIGTHIVVSDTFTDVKRIDVSIPMDNINIVKRLKTDKFDINIDEEVYPKISAYLKNISETELNMLCTLILND
jgi:hypothetical protein